MSATSLLARIGLRLGTLGSVASLAIAAPIAEGDVSNIAHTAASRSGLYFPTNAQIGIVTNGVERIRVFDDGAVQIGGTMGASPGVGAIDHTSAFGITTRAAATQDAVQVVGRGGGLGSFVVTVTPATLSANRIFSLPDVSGTAHVGNGAADQIAIFNAPNGIISNAGLTAPTVSGALLMTLNSGASTAVTGASLLSISGSNAAGVTSNGYNALNIAVTGDAGAAFSNTLSLTNSTLTITSAATTFYSGATLRGNRSLLTLNTAAAAGTSFFIAEGSRSDVAGVATNAAGTATFNTIRGVCAKINFNAGLGTSALSSMTLFYGDAIAMNSAGGNVNIASMYGMFLGTMGGAGTVATDVYGIQTGVPGNGTFTNTYGFYMPSGGGSVTNRFGVYIADAAARNVFVGNTVVGGTAAVALTKFAITPAATTTSRSICFAIVGAANTGATAGTEVPDVNWSLDRTVQWNTGALALQRAVIVGAQTIAFVGASTVTNAITLDVATPAAGTNATLTNSWAIRALGAGGVVSQQASTQDAVQILGRAGGTSNFVASITTAALTGSRIITLPDAAGTVPLGTGAAGQMTYWSSANALTGNAAWTLTTLSGALRMAATPTSTATTAVTAYAMSVNLAANPGAASTSTYAAITASLTSTTSGNQIGATYVGVWSSPNYGAGSANTLGILYGVRSEPTITMSTGATSTVTTTYGLYARPVGSSATGTTVFTTYYGLYLDTAQQVGGGTLTVTNRFGVYQADTLAANVFNGAMTTANQFTIAVQSIVSAAGTTVLTTAHFVVVTGSTTQSLTLPAATTGRWLLIKNRSSGLVTVDRAGADTIDGGTSYAVIAGAAIMLVADGTDWTVN
jgi:hypothetical protein